MNETTRLLIEKEQSPPAIKLEWQNISQVQKVRSHCFSRTTTSKTILDKVSGQAEPGGVLAIMGPSGAGKTSLLNILAGRTALQSGKTLVNGQLTSSMNLRQLSVYVMQDDILLEVFTVRESILFSARLRLPASMSLGQKTDRVDALIHRFGLSNCADSFIRSISGGERKRTSIAIELITNPMVLFLDEPTSGLDSATALLVMRIIKQLALDDGRTVITTIHQPSSDLFSLFQRLLLLANGRVAYEGEAKSVLDYFATIGYVAPLHYNPADYVIKILSVDEEKNERTGADIEVILQAFSRSKLEASCSTIPAGHSINDPVSNLLDYQASMWEQATQLSLRSFKIYLRNPLRFYVACAQTILVAMLVSLVYMNLGNDLLSITDRAGFFFFSVTSFVFVATVGLVLSMPNERSVFLREQDNNMYPVWAYYLAKVLSEIPLQIFFPLIFTLLVYWSVGLNYVTHAKVFIFWIAIILLNLNGQATGMLIGVSVPDALTAMCVVPIYIIPTLLFCGYFKELETLPSYLVWISYVSSFKWGLDILLVNEFTDLELTCRPSDFPGSACPISSGEQYLAFKNLEYDDMIKGGVALAILTVASHIIAWIILELVVIVRKRTSIRQ